jgi:putative membrane protein
MNQSRKETNMTINKIKQMSFMLGPLLFLSLWSCTRYPMGQSGPYGGGHMMDFGFGGIFMWLIFLALAGFIVYIVMQSRKSGESGGLPSETPLDILKKRYARGDITKKEFESLKKDIDS